MQVWLSVAWMKSPGSMMRSRATSWQMPGETPSFAEKSRTPVWRWNSRCMLAQGLDLVHERRHARHVVGVDEVVLEDGELARGFSIRVVRAVLLLEEVVHLGGGELVGVAAVDATTTASPGFTKTSLSARRRRMWRARIFSAMVIGRGAVCRPRQLDARRAASALENGNSPPCWITSCVIGS